MFSISVDTIQRYYCSTVWPPPAAIAAAILLGMDSLSELRYSGVIALQTLRGTFVIPSFDVAICLFVLPTLRNSIIDRFSPKSNWGIIKEKVEKKVKKSNFKRKKQTE